MSGENSSKPVLLLHVCCAPCSAYVAEELSREYHPILYFYNPNIHPEEEYVRRRDEAKAWAENAGIAFVEDGYDKDRWFELAKGLEGEPERGARCEVCFEMRLEAAAIKAKELGADIFGAALSVSPHKDAVVINRVGQEAGRKSSVSFLSADFKKKDGFKLSMKKARELGLYRQDYCGCVYSMRKGKGQG